MNKIDTAEILLKLIGKILKSEDYNIDLEEKPYWSISNEDAFLFRKNYKVSVGDVSDLREYIESGFDADDKEMISIDLDYISELLRYLSFKMKSMN